MVKERERKKEREGESIVSVTRRGVSYNERVFGSRVEQKKKTMCRDGIIRYGNWIFYVTERIKDDDGRTHYCVFVSLIAAWYFSSSDLAGSSVL